MMILYDENNFKLFNLNRVNFNYFYYVLEGFFDLMFIDNLIVIVGGKISFELLKLNCNKLNFIVIYDNEFRNKEVVFSNRFVIFVGYNIVIWFEKIDYKDINEFVLVGYFIDNILLILKENIFKGLEVELRLNEWLKV